VKRVLIVNADDFGQTEGINRGVARTHEQGIVTSASLMVRFPAAEQAAAYACEHPDLSVGLHIDLWEWAYRGGRWRQLYDRAGDVAGEIAQQLELFRRLVGQDPTHLDSHQHAHRGELARSVVVELGERLGVPVRDFSPRVRYRGNFYGQGSRDAAPYPELIGVDALIALIRSLEPGVTELGCHPGETAGLVSTYVEEREREIETLCDPRVRDAIAGEGIELRSFRDAFSPS
jgi:chitin disaccharide deacetylase